jgi:YesN/AraC family two-component response regulator
MTTSSLSSIRSDFSVLVVDDEQFLRQILVRIVKRDGYQVEEAANGKEALEKMAGKHFDLVITDVKMPEIDGMELLARVKKEYPEVQVVVVTSHSSEVNATEAVAAGASQFISKPFNNIEITHTLDNLIARRKRARH